MSVCLSVCKSLACVWVCVYVCVFYVFFALRMPCIFFMCSLFRARFQCTCIGFPFVFLLWNIQYAADEVNVKISSKYTGVYF